MGGSVYGELFRLSTFGESHGKGVGLVLEGVRPGLEICEEEVQKELDRRKPGQSDVTTPRKESDLVHFISGVFEGRATGTPLAMTIWNQDQRPEAYADIQDVFRPGHADYTYLKKYGIRDHRGSGRASGRETAARVAAGAVARKMFPQFRILAYTQQVGDIAARQVVPEFIEKNPVRCPDPEVADQMEALIRQAGSEQDSVGGIVECQVQGLPAGLGEPVFDKLDAELAKAMLSLGAVKGIEFGTGFGAVEMRGSQHNDSMTAKGFSTNHGGGVLGGISTGETLIFRMAVKPTSSIARPQQTLNTRGEEVTIRVEGRHDPCICPRLVPVVEAMTAIVLADLALRQKACNGEPAGK